MTYKDKFLLSKTWQNRVLIMSLYHHLKMFKVPKWNMRKTAKYFDVSLGLVSENIAIAKRMDDVRGCNTRKEALMRIK